MAIAIGTNSRGGIAKQGKNTRSTPFTPIEPITPAALSGTVTPIKVTEPLPATEGVALASTIQDTTDQYTKNLEANAAKSQESKQTALDAYLQSIMAPGKESLTADAYAQPNGVDTIQTELDDINQQILQEQNSLRRRLESIDMAGGGLQSGAQAEKQNLERESLRKQADLSIIQMGVQGRFDSAKAIADRAVSAQLERDLQKQNVLGTIYQDNKDQFTQDEQRAFEAAQADRDRAIADKKEQETKRYNLAIDAMTNGAPSALVSQMLAAKTPEDAMAIGGSYIGMLDRQAKIASIRASSASAALNEAQLAAETAKAAQIQQAIESGQVILDKDQQEIAYKLGKDFENSSKDFMSRVQSMNTINAAASEASAAGDLALIFSYMKMLDPGSAVREQEFANAQNAAGVPERIRAAYNNTLRGERLTTSTRNDFVDRAGSIYESSLKQQIQLEHDYRDRAISVFGLPENAADLVIKDVRATSVTESANLPENNGSDDPLGLFRSSETVDPRKYFGSYNSPI